MSKIKIVVDTGADVPEEYLKRYDIGVLHFLSIFDEETFVTGVDITTAEFYEKLAASDIIPTTAQTPYGDMYDYLLEQAKANDSVIYFALSSKATGQSHTASLVAEEIKEEYPQADIHIVDTEKFSVYIAQTAIHAAQMAESGASVEEIIAECKAYIKTWRCYLLVNTLKYLEKGGRLNKAAAFVGTLLDVKPILTIEHGLVENMENLRGKKKLVEKLIEKIEEDPDFERDNPEFIIAHSDAARADEICEKLSEMYGEGCVKLVCEIGPIIGTHVGEGAFAILPKIKVN